MDVSAVVSGVAALRLGSPGVPAPPPSSSSNDVEMADLESEAPAPAQEGEEEAVEANWDFSKFTTSALILVSMGTCISCSRSRGPCGRERGQVSSLCGDGALEAVGRLLRPSPQPHHRLGHRGYVGSPGLSCSGVLAIPTCIPWEGQAGETSTDQQDAGKYLFLTFKLSILTNA
jgi:hypothetical protein